MGDSSGPFEDVWEATFEGPSDELTVVVPGAGGIVGLFISDRARINEVLKRYNAAGWVLERFTRQVHTNLAYSILKYLCLVGTLFVWNPDATGLLFFRRPHVEGAPPAKDLDGGLREQLPILLAALSGIVLLYFGAIVRMEMGKALFSGILGKDTGAVEAAPELFDASVPPSRTVRNANEVTAEPQLAPTAPSGRLTSIKTEATHEVFGTESDPKAPWLSLREQPSMSSTLLVTMPDGTRVRRGEALGGWYRVDVASGPSVGRSGYAWGKFLRPLADAPADPPPSQVAGDAPEGMVRVPAATFTMGSDSGKDSERPSRSVTLVRAFFIDRTEVTAGAYATCVQRSACTATSIHGPASTEKQVAELAMHCTGADAARTEHPINCVDRAQAEVYCRFAGKRLPTEAEWELAARGTDGRTFPWGAEGQGCRQANVGGCKGGTMAVGSIPDGRSAFGLLDVAGNVWEWVDDGWSDRPVEAGISDPRVTRGSAQLGVLRGGSWDFSLPYARASSRLKFSAASGHVSTGIRCARDAAAPSR